MLIPFPDIDSATMKRGHSTKTKLNIMRISKLMIAIAAGLIAFTTTAQVINDDRVPVHRPLIEEYTGTWCGWCVRGLVGMELLKQRFGDEFIGVAYHNGDPMEIMSSNDFPNDFWGFPTAFIERAYEVDPYYGFGNTSAGIISDMEQFAAMNVIADAFVTAQWTSDEKTAIDVDVTSYFTIDAGAYYALEIMLIADDLHGSSSSWNQKNYYNGSSSYSNDPYLGPWVKKPGSVSGYHFNDVIVGTSGVVSGSLPDKIIAYNDYSFHYSFTLSSLPVPSLIQNKDNLHVIAVIINKKNGQVVNANRCFISDYQTVTYGDVNDDGKANIDDVTALINYLLSQDETLINITNADIDSDGRISIDDVTALINFLLSQPE